MIVMFEATDKSGKSTLLSDVAKRIQQTEKGIRGQVLTYKTQEKPVDETDVAYYQYKAIHDLAKQNPEKIILVDRGYLSELVYSKVKRGYDAYNAKDYRSEFMLDSNVMLVYVSTNKDVIKKRFKDEKEEYLQPEEIDLIVDRYEYFMTMTGHKKVIVYGTDDRDQNAKIVTDEIVKAYLTP